MAAPSKRTPARVAAILDAIRLGQPLMRAASAGGIGYTTMREWLDQSASFRYAVDAAIGEGERYVLGELRGVIKAGDTRAMLEWLARRFPAEWGSKQQVEVTGTVNVRLLVQQVVSVLDAELPADPALRGRIAARLLALDSGASASGGNDDHDQGGAE
jgi:hypothetical protein